MSRKTKTFFIVIVVLIAAAFIIVKMQPKTNAVEVTKEIKPTVGSLETIISATGMVLPKNRLEIKPPVNGRVESILVAEGQHVESGQTLAWMSSTERAALLDAARGQGPEELNYWQKAYKPIELLAPINAEVIVATIQPGQTVTTADAVVVLSDHLIVRAQVDETDIGKIKLKQKATVILDAYPDTKIKAAVEHIYYESKTVNNVTIYDVDLIPEEVPEFFRSGMNATINFVENSKENTLILPLEAVLREKEGNFVLLKQNGAQEPLKRQVKLGISDEKNAEIASGINVSDIIVVKSKKISLPNNKAVTNPLLPFGRKRTTQGR